MGHESPGVAGPTPGQSLEPQISWLVISSWSPAPPGVAVAGLAPRLPGAVPHDGRGLLADLGQGPGRAAPPDDLLPRARGQELHPPSLAGVWWKQQVNNSRAMMNR